MHLQSRAVGLSVRTHICYVSYNTVNYSPIRHYPWSKISVKYILIFSLSFRSLNNNNTQWENIDKQQKNHSSAYKVCAAPPDAEAPRKPNAHPNFIQRLMKPLGSFGKLYDSRPVLTFQRIKQWQRSTMNYSGTYPLPGLLARECTLPLAVTTSPFECVLPTSDAVLPTSLGTPSLGCLDLSAGFISQSLDSSMPLHGE